MTANAKRVFYVKYLPHACFIDILGERPDVTLTRVENDAPPPVADPVLSAAHAYQVGSTRDELAAEFHVTPALLARAPNLLLVSTHGAGYDTVDLEACTAAGVVVVNQSGGNREAVAEHVVGMLLCLAKRIVECDRALRAGTLRDRNSFMGHDIVGKTIGIVGIGNVGSRVAELCRGLFGMRVLACDPLLTKEQIAARGAEKVELDALLREADFVSINCPRIRTTENMIGAREFALMKPHSYFITTARGGIHDEAALEAALASGKLAGAGLDVWAKEPPPADHPLLRFDNVVASAHTAGVTHEARINMGRYAAEQILETLDGKRPPRILNPEVWPRYAERFARILGTPPQ
jgi:D-3-phosphoglycerate dehydrogenase